MVESNLDRINAVRRRLTANLSSKDLPSTKRGNVKTLVVRIPIENFNGIQISNSTMENLDRLFDDYSKMKETILSFIYKKFQNNPLELMRMASKKTYAERHGDDLTLCLDGDKPIDSGFQCIDCNAPMHLFYGRIFKTDKGKDKKLVFAKCSDNTCRSLPIQLEEEKNKDEEGNEFNSFKIGSFTDQSLQPFIYKTFIKKNSEKYLGEMDSYHSKSVGDILSKVVSGTICSFLTKYQDVLIDHQKTVSVNKKLVNKLENIATEKGLTLPAFVLPEQPKNREEVEKYNRIVGKLRIWTNLNLWQKLRIDRDVAKPPLRLKGFPSFPVIERLSNAVNWIETANNFSALANAYTEMARRFWAGIPDEERESILEDRRYIFKREIAAEDIAKDKETKNGKYAKRQLGDLLLHLKGKHKGDWGKIFDEASARAGKKIDGLLKHIASIPDDNKAKKALSDWLRAWASFMGEALKDSDKYIDYESACQKHYGDLRGQPFIKAGRNRVIEVGGFGLDSSGNYPQYRAVLAWENGGGGKREYVFILNYKKDNKIKFYGADEVFSEGTFKGMFYRGGMPVVRPLNFDANDNNLIVLPLAFGKRQGREFLWNMRFGLDTGKLVMNNARIIEKHLFDRESGEEKAALFLALTFERKEVLDGARLDLHNMIGIDRGEKIPAVIALTDPDGCPLPRFKNEDGTITHIMRIGEDYDKKQDKIQAAKAEEQKIMGGYSRKFAHKSKNFADHMVRTTARSLLSKAVENDACLVFEDLSRGFGRQGKGTLMSKRQYTKMEDWLVGKLKYEGLWTHRGQLRSGQRHNFIAKTISQYTSKTCSKCGYVLASSEFPILLERLRKSDGVWLATLTSGTDVPLPETVNYFSKDHGKMISRNVHQELDAFMGKSAGEGFLRLSQTDKDNILSLLRKSLNVRPAQDKFKCLNCGHEDHADEQAALNIARSWLFMQSPEYDKYKKQKGEKLTGDRSFVEAWMSFYRRRLGEAWSQNP
jgi:hypothetical protein